MSSTMPTFRGVDHVGYTVPDLDQAVRFFTEVFGAELITRVGPFEDPSGDTMTERLGVHPRSVLNLALLRVGSVNNLEFLEYKSPDQNETAPKVSDVGAAHLGVYVDDLEAAREYLRTVAGVTVYEGPNPIPGDQPIGGENFQFILTPWGMVIELLNWPPHMPYEKETPIRLYRPV